MKSLLFFLLVFAAAVLVFPSNALACACCAETGAYYLRTGKIETYELDLLKEMKFAESAALFMTEAGMDGMKGLSALEKDMESESWVASPADFSLVNSFVAKTWKFQFKTPTGKSGTLSLPMPAQMLSYSVDIHDGSDRGLGPLLYKEWRFKGIVTSGTGIFKPSIVRPTSYFLVFQGRGRGCDDVRDFGYWRLEITGKNADYAFFGKFSSGDPSLFETEEEEEQPGDQ